MCEYETDFVVRTITQLIFKLSMFPGFSPSLSAFQNHY